MVRVKICGITNWADAKLAVDEGADALGFNFYPPSPRSVSPADAWEVVRRLPPFVASIGVFVDWKPAVVSLLARALRLSGVQLHGQEPVVDVKALADSTFVIKAIQAKPGVKPESLKKYVAANAILLDGFRAGLHGGTGQTLDWNFARRARRYANIILAGGLTPENVAKAVAVAQPYAVDVASGVEKRPGKKDPAKVRAFIQAVGREGN
jgi:phosphoribosylanthranilate isomerase